ncbi:MAG: hypothetical protein LBV72_03050 [Tannerella sp.]|jgi:hypothetical protein|nr:hypothetical protein [Tannerella sp.]
MKKVNAFGAIFLMAIVLFTSCLGDGSNTQSATTVGVVRYDYKSGKYLLDTYGWGVFYSSALNSTTEGACYYFNFELDYDLADNNSSVVNTTGYYTISIGTKYEVARYSMSPVLLDTTTLLTNEIPLVNPLASVDGYVKGIFFLQHTYKQPEDQKYAWSLSYDTQNAVIEESGKRIYDVFIRAAISGSAGTKTATEGGVANAYNMKSFFESAAYVEKNQTDKVVNVRFNYVSDITDGKIVWKKSDIISVYTDLILAEDN